MNITLDWHRQRRDDVMSIANDMPSPVYYLADSYSLLYMMYPLSLCINGCKCGEEVLTCYLMKHTPTPDQADLKTHSLSLFTCSQTTCYSCSACTSLYGLCFLKMQDNIHRVALHDADVLVMRCILHS